VVTVITKHNSYRDTLILNPTTSLEFSYFNTNNVP